MKKLKILFFSIIVFVFTLGIFSFLPNKLPYNPSLAAPTDTTIDYNPLNYISLVSENQILNNNQLVRVESSHYSMTVNGSTTINLRPFHSKYTDLSNFDETYFTKNIITFEVPYSKNMTFEYKGKLMHCFYETEGSGLMRNYFSFAYASENENDESYIPVKLPVTSLDNILISWYSTTISDTEMYFTFTIIDSITVNVDKIEKSQDFNFSIFLGYDGRTGVITSANLKLTFCKPVIKFASASNPIVNFESFKDFNQESNTYNYYEKDTWLQSEETFNKIRLTFLNDQYEYTKENPLYFRINFNGFTYNLKLYSEIIAEENCLFVNYVDGITNKTEQFATNYEELLDIYDNPYISFIEKVMSNQQFSINFTYRGRYQIEFYDNTYLQEFENPNYYITSFYLQNDASGENALDAKFDDIYILAQTLDENNKPMDYIVNTSTLNTSVKVTLKNLPEDKLIEEYNELATIIDRIDVTVTIYGTSAGNHPIRTSYYPTTTENQFDESIKHLSDIFSIDENGDYYLIYHDDAHYKISVHAKNESYKPVYDKDGNPMYDNNGDQVYDPYKKETIYIFSILKNTKASFDPVVDNPDDDPDFDASYTPTEPYKTETIYYSNKIKNNDPIRFVIEYKDSTPKKPERILDIVFNNEYYVKYGMQVSEIKWGVNEDNNAITFMFYGVGDLSVEIDFNGQISYYTFNSEKNDNTITFTEYGKYRVSLVDSMNTIAAPENINFSKGLNVSALILIGLACIIVAFIAIFFVSVRGRIRTR